MRLVRTLFVLHIHFQFYSCQTSFTTSSLVDNGESVPLSSEEMQEFFLKKNQTDKAWRQEQRDSIAYLHTFQNNTVDARSSFSSKRRDFISASSSQEMDPFYQQQRAMDQEWKRQQQDSIAHLHNYRDNAAAAGLLNGKNNGHNTKPNMVTPITSADESDYDVHAAIAFHETQRTLQEQMELAVNCPLPPDLSPDVLSSSSTNEQMVTTTVMDSEQHATLKELSPVDNNDDSLTKLLQVVEEPSSSSTEEVYKDSSTASAKEDPYQEEEAEPVPSVESANVLLERVEIYKDNDVLSTETNFLLEKESLFPVDDSVGAIEQLSLNDTEEANARNVPGVGDSSADMELGAVADDHVTLLQLDVTDNDHTESTVVSKEVGNADHDETFAGDTADVFAPDEEVCLLDEKVEANDTNMGLIVLSSENAADALEELLGQGDVDECRTSNAETTKDATNNEAFLVESLEDGVTPDSTQTSADTRAIATPTKQSQRAPMTPPRRRSATSRKGASKIVRPSKRVTTSDWSGDSDGLPHYMKPTMSTPERKSKATSSGPSPVKPRSPLYSRRETAESFKIKSNKCTNKWIPSLHSSRDGCERCLYFADEKERLKFQRDGHHYRVCSVRGGCSRSCPCFPRRPDQPPVRLCRKCFYDTHRLGKM